MKTTLATQIVILLLVLLPIAAVPIMGAWVLIASVCLLLLLLMQVPSGWSVRVGLMAGVVGGVVGVLSAGAALASLGGQLPYATRAGFGWTALVLAIVAAAGGLVATRAPRPGAALMLGAGLLGSLLINLFTINTFYVLAMLFWLASGLLALRGPEAHSAHDNAPSA